MAETNPNFYQYNVKKYFETGMYFDAINMNHNWHTLYLCGSQSKFVVLEENRYGIVEQGFELVHDAEKCFDTLKHKVTEYFNNKTIGKNDYSRIEEIVKS